MYLNFNWLYSYDSDIASFISDSEAITQTPNPKPKPKGNKHEKL